MKMYFFAMMSLFCDVTLFTDYRNLKKRFIDAQIRLTKKYFCIVFSLKRNFTKVRKNCKNVLVFFCAAIYL